LASQTAVIRPISEDIPVLFPVTREFSEEIGSTETASATTHSIRCAFTVDFDRKEMGYSPDRVDALVWALTELMIEGGARRRLLFV
jgi:hypothetical protein